MPVTDSNEERDPKTSETEKNDPIDRPGEVPASNDEKIDQDFPGYPHYPAEEDIMHKGNNTGREEVDVENLSRAHKITAENLQEAGKPAEDNPAFSKPGADEGGDLGRTSGTDADVTKEDLLLLGDRDEDMDLGEDEDIPKELMVTGEDLDLPGAELDDANEEIGEEDEENNYYSLGGDNHENLEEDTRNNY